MNRDFGVNQGHVEELYLKYRENTTSVSTEWRAFFDDLDEDPIPHRKTGAGITSPGQLGAPGFAPALTESSLGAIRAAALPEPKVSLRHSFLPSAETQAATELQSGVSAMVNAYRVRG